MNLLLAFFLSLFLFVSCALVPLCVADGVWSPTCGVRK